MERPIIYQLFPRIFTNTNSTNIPFGKLHENGSGKFNDINPSVIKSLKEMGITTLWLTGVIEHATKTDFRKYGIELDNPNVVKGEAGSPYAIKDYYDVDPALAENVTKRMEEFESLVKKIHAEGLKVIIDFVPNHTARHYHSDLSPEGIEDFGVNDNRNMSFLPSNNYYYITNQKFFPEFSLSEEGEEPYIEFPSKATGNDCFTAFCGKNDWYETVKLNYGHDYANGSDHFNPIPDTWFKMLHILRYWCSKGIDGFRCDMVFMVPLEFWHWAIPQVKEKYSEVIFIGEIYDIASYRPFIEYGHFDYLYDKVNLYDTLVGIETKGWSAAQLTGCWQTVDGIGDKMLNFLENHDEVRFASKSFAGDAMKIVPYLITSCMISKGPVLIYYGQELGEKGEDNEGFAGFNDRTSIFDYWSVSTLRRWFNEGKCDGKLLTQHEKWLRKLYSKVLNLCNSNNALREGDFFDLMYVNLYHAGFDPHSIFTFIRYTKKEALLIVANFSKDEKFLKINIPEIAFEMANLKEGEFEPQDLLWNKRHIIKVSRTEPICLTINGYDALILRLEVN